jgi:hypothetical protein
VEAGVEFYWGDAALQRKARVSMQLGYGNLSIIVRKEIRLQSLNPGAKAVWRHLKNTS